MNIVRKTIVYGVYFFSSLFPRDKNRFIYIGWHKNSSGEVFADNTKYLFLYANKHSQNQKHIWLAKSKILATKLVSSGLHSSYEFSLQGVWHMLRAKYFVIDALFQPQHFMFSGRAKIIQLLHGKGMKKKGYSEAQLKKQDFIFGTSQYSLSLLPESFIKGSKLFVTGYPRNDILFSQIEKADIDIDTDMLSHLKKQKAKGKKNIFYAPTFRRGEKEALLKGLDMDKLVAWAKEKNVHVVLSLHNKYRNQQDSHNLGEHISSLKESDIYPLLCEFDLFVTDYSSSFIDFLLLDKPIIFYPFDFDTYSVNEGIIQDYFKMIPGPHATNFKQLLNIIEENLKQDTWQEKRQISKHKNHSFCDGNSAERVFKVIDSLETSRP